MQNEIKLYILNLKEKFYKIWIAHLSFNYAMHSKHRLNCILLWNLCKEVIIYKSYTYIYIYKIGELFFHLRKAKRFEEKRAKLYAAEIILALEHLHSKNIIYRLLLHKIYTYIHSLF